jgi:hypothetical protein
MTKRKARQNDKRTAAGNRTKRSGLLVDSSVLRFVLFPAAC